MGQRSAFETIDIESAGNAVAVTLGGSTIVSLHIRGDAAAQYEIDARPRGESWIPNIASSYSGSADYDDVIETGVEQLRVRCSAGTGGSGDTADVYLSSGGA